MNCDHSKTYRSMYKAYTNGTNPAGYAADIFEKKYINRPQHYNFNTLNETTHNNLITLGRPPLISCKDGSKEDNSKNNKIYCPSVDKYLSEYECPMYKACDCKNSKNCRECVKAKCMRNYECSPLCLSRAGGLIINNNQSACNKCEQVNKSV